MAKGWTQLNTINDVPKNSKTQQEKNKAATRADNLIRSTPSLKAEELKKQGILHFNQKKSEEDALLDAFKEKRLKSKTLIKHAIKIKKEREAEAKKKEAATETIQDKDPEVVNNN
jgi:hypothetical protein